MLALRAEWILPDSVYSNPLLRLTAGGLKCYGILLGSGQRHQRLHCLRGVLLTGAFLLFNLTQYVDLWQIWGDVTEMTTNAATTLLFTTTGVRLLLFYANRARFNEIVRRADAGIRQIELTGTDPERAILAANVRYLHRLTAMFWVCAFVTANTMCVYTLAEWLLADIPRPVAILRAWYPAADRIAHFYDIYAIQLFVMLVGQLIVPSWHSLMVALMVYVRTEYEILNHRVARGTDTATCVDHHVNLLRYTADLQRLMAGAVLVDFVIFSSLLCALLFELSVTESGVKMFIDACYITTMITILFLYYWHANEIHYHADRLMTSAYTSDWYRNSPRRNQHLLLLMQGSSRAQKMRAHFITMSLDTLLAVLRASYSIFTLLKQVAD